MYVGLSSVSNLLWKLAVISAFQTISNVKCDIKNGKLSPKRYAAHQSRRFAKQHSTGRRAVRMIFENSLLPKPWIPNEHRMQAFCLHPSWCHRDNVPLVGLTKWLSSTTCKTKSFHRKLMPNECTWKWECISKHTHAHTHSVTHIRSIDPCVTTIWASVWERKCSLLHGFSSFA